MHRHGFTEECYFDYTFSPVRGEGGGVEGVFNAVLETTTRVIGERRLRTLRELGAWKTGEARDAQEACQTATHTLAENPHDLPFGLLYLLDGDGGRRASLAGLTGLDRDAAASPAAVELDAADAPWPFRRVVESGQAVVVDHLADKFGPLPGGAWPEPPQRAVVLPMAKSGQTRPAGFVVAGVSPRLALNDDYRGFLDLLASHVAAAVASARAYGEERKRAEALAELDRAKTAFFSNVSHEFRTPLTLMLGPVEDLLARSHTDLPPAAAAQLEVVNRNGLRLLRLVNTLLDFSRIEAGRVRAAFLPTDLAALTADLASVFRAACDRAGLRLVVDCPPLAGPVHVDREMWEKVVLNLLSNAFKFTFEGEIAVTLRRVGTAAELRVRDTGTGIPAGEVPRLFERFHRVENARGRTHEGSGIGLALVQELVRLHGGSITAESEVGRGTTFVVTVPTGTAHLPPDQIGGGRPAAAVGAGAAPYVEEALRWLPDGEDGRPELPPPHVLVPAARRPPEPDDDRPRVLVADDNADMRQYVANLLAGQYRTEVVPDGEAALAAVRRQPPDLLLTDVMMPRLDGFGLLRELRADPGTRGLPVILLSARAGEDSRVEGMEAGADDYLVKPFTARELVARVSAHLQMARLRREAGELIRQSHAQFEALFNAAPVGVYLVDADLKIRQVNPKARPVFGDIPDLIGSDFGEVVHALWPKPYAAEIVGRFRRTLETGEPYSVPERAEERLDRRATEYYEWQINRIPLPDGRYGVVCYFNDISRHVLARLELADRGRQLRESEDRYRTLFESMDEGYCIIEVIFDPPGGGRAVDYRFVEVNPAFEAQAGMHAVTGRRMREFVPKIEDHWLENYGRVALTGEPVRFANEYTGLNRWFEVYAFRVGPPGGHRVAVLFTDITARMHGEREREALVGRLREQDRQKDEFLATLAHELRNPLAPLRNGLQVMKLAGGDGRAVERSRSMMERQVEQLARLVDDLMDLSRISRGKIALRKTRMRLAAAVRDAVETSRPLIEQQGHDLTLDVPDESAFVDADGTRLCQVFANLLNNAAKYTDRGGRIRLAVERVGHEAVVTVEDTGVGIPAHMLPRVFDMFAQVDRSIERAQGGLGIGLNIVKRLVEMHGGSIEAESGGHGTGSKFRVRLPVVLSLTSDAPDRPDGRATPAARRRILMVDDNRDGAISLAEMLNIMGNETQTAHDGLEAVAVAEAFKPDVILMDIGMPNLNGYDACRRIREHPWGKGVVIVAQTGWGQEDDKKKSQEAGFDFHMVKPVDPADLEKLLAEAQAATG
jgi:PAS domain S-box-containing protein